MVVVSIVGMAGSGKSEVARRLERNGFTRVRFGDVTDEEVRKRGLPLTEENERLVREQLRKEYGMAAYARLNLPRIEVALERGDVALDGLYSWEEYLFFADHYGKEFRTVAVWASPEARYARLASRSVRRLPREQAVSRDRAEIENLNKGGPIAMADFTIVNDAGLDSLAQQVERVIGLVRRGS